jgi:hypothetical protein
MGKNRRCILLLDLTEVFSIDSSADVRRVGIEVYVAVINHSRSHR